MNLSLIYFAVTTIDLASKSFPCPAYGKPSLFPISRKVLNTSLIEFFKNAPMKFQSHCVLHHSTYFPIVTNFNEILWICSVHTSLVRYLAKSLKWTGNLKISTVFPWLLSGKTKFFDISRWGKLIKGGNFLCTDHDYILGKSGETIQGRTLFKGEYWWRKYSI